MASTAEPRAGIRRLQALKLRLEGDADSSDVMLKSTKQIPDRADRKRKKERPLKGKGPTTKGNAGGGGSVEPGKERKDADRPANSQRQGIHDAVTATLASSRHRKQILVLNGEPYPGKDRSMAAAAGDAYTKTTRKKAGVKGLNTVQRRRLHVEMLATETASATLSMKKLEPPVDPAKAKAAAMRQRRMRKLRARRKATGEGDSFIKSTYSGSKGLNDLAKATAQNISDFGMITPGNAMKWDATEPSQNSFSFTKGDQVVALAKASGAKVRCHTLVWHQQVPSWVQTLGKAELLKALENHITKVITHFGDSCYAWDVVNEAMGDDGTYRKSFWYTKTGTEYISTAFKTASAVKKSLGLKTKLYYNDYNTNTINTKSTAVLAMLKSLISAGVEVNGVGFQSHLSYSDTASASDQISNMRLFEALKLDVALTELDVKTSSTAPSTAEQSKQVTVYKNAVLACRKLSKCVGVTIWDFVDTYTWLSSSAPLPWYQPKGKNTPLVRKAAYDGIAAAWQS
ncbi:Glycosyl hydrolase family 10 protein [Phytophthora cinnamomi]|uniref:Glycosyl hydrolase family 10 protein n=1 Tax=Phytophthora cinnamomi TaxID=4785 RepID=UPI00355A8723|nr:Glycosyl hydrolase family 10 protein [Phytophthora cinnamomi]